MWSRCDHSQILGLGKEQSKQMGHAECLLVSLEAPRPWHEVTLLHGGNDAKPVERCQAL